MIDLEPLHNLELNVSEPDEIDIDLSVRNHLLFSEINRHTHAIMCERYLVEASNFYSKLDTQYPVTILSDDSFEKLYNHFLELRTDKAIANMQKGQDETVDQEDEELNLREFLRTSADLLTSEESAPIIKFVNALFYQAIKKRASDIHIEAHESRGEVRFRIDGILSKNVDLDRRAVALIVSRIKVISNLDISEKRIPQDGRTQVKISGKTLDIRVSILPTFYGERVVMRILMQNDQIPSIENLGFPKSTISQIKKLLNNSHGMILVTGPTGSGKTTSLHSFLREVESEETNIITVEDPVEYKSEAISQLQVNEKVGLTFANAIRSILRQDPDIIMVGEIRDEETASIAVRAALTGHLVFSTLHTNSAAATVSRLVDMRIEPFLIASSVLGVLAQRLVRVLCDKCKSEDIPAEAVADDFNLPKDTTIYKANGCKKCSFSGYSGRRSIGELMVMDDEIRSQLKGDSDEQTIKKLLAQKKIKSISSQLSLMVLEGATSLDEALRIGLTHEQ